MRIHHFALYTRDLERMRRFYQEYFLCDVNPLYHNPRTGLRTYFLTFPEGGCLEIMTRPDLADTDGSANRTGYAHLSLGVESREKVDALVERLKAAGVHVAGVPRTTGDGYYEAVILDPDGNMIEIMALQ